MRRSLLLFGIGAALASALPASATLLPVRRTFGDVAIPRLRAGSVAIPRGHRRGEVRVIVRLAAPPLAAEFEQRQLAGVTSARRLEVASRFSRAYLAQLAAAQRRATVALHRTLPQARVGRHFRVLLDGLTVTLPARRLPTLARLRFVTRIYPTLQYTLNTNRSPSVIGADVLQQETGARGDGMKIGIVDDGVDQTNPYLRPDGFSYPAGFPRGDLKFTSPKVIVARSFPGPGAGARGRLPVDRQASFHGTHVAGIAAGDANTNAPAGTDHPAVSGLSGVAPRAWLGNYRVFTVPTPVGHVADTPEIVAAFESAVADGMNVINFSGGGPQTDPANDAMVEAVQNTVAAGVVPVIAAGNDRDDYGLGSVGSPGTVPAAITVAAVSNTHVFAPALDVTARGAPQSLQGIPVQAGANRIPATWSSDHTLVDVGSIVGTDGAPVDRSLCGPPEDPNNPDKTTLPPGSLTGDLALVSRGTCTFFSKSERAQAAGAVGIVLVDNRPGEANPVPVALTIPAVMISDLDGARLRAFAPQMPVRIGTDPLELVTGRSGIITSFSSAGPTDFGHDLKPDVAAPGAQILSSTLPEYTGGSPFAVFDGTSMATPHVAGAAALLLELHPGWTPEEVKSALVSTAGPAWADTARTKEAPVLLEGGGLVGLPRAADPKIFTDPTSLSFHELDVTHGDASRALLVRVSDAGGGAGTWTVSLDAQSATNGATIEVPGTIVVPPGGEGDLSVVARATAAADKGENYGFLVLHQGGVTRRIPYDFLVTRPGLTQDPVLPLYRFQLGNTMYGSNHVTAYCCPAAPFGPAANYVGPPMNEDGAEHVYVTHVNNAVANMGVAVTDSLPGSQIDPFFLGSRDENDVQGYAGTPVNVNEYMFDYKVDIGAAGAEFPRQQTFYVAVDSGTDPFTGQSLAGPYLLRTWVNDVTPPTVRLLTRRVSAGRPTLIVRATDRGAGVDPLSLVIAYNHVLLGAALYDPATGLAVFPLPSNAPKLLHGKTPAVIVASDFQESKNINTNGANIMPNTTFKQVRLTTVTGPAVTWVLPVGSSCLPRTARLVVTATSTANVKSVRFYDGRHRIGVDANGGSDLFATTWSTREAKAGRHLLRAVARDARGRTFGSTRAVRVCR